jgi:hypothetical protein
MYVVTFDEEDSPYPGDNPYPGSGTVDVAAVLPSRVALGTAEPPCPIQGIEVPDIPVEGRSPLENL